MIPSHDHVMTKADANQAASLNLSISDHEVYCLGKYQIGIRMLPIGETVRGNGFVLPFVLDYETKVLPLGGDIDASWGYLYFIIESCSKNREFIRKDMHGYQGTFYFS